MGTPAGRWDFERQGPLRLEAIRLLYPPAQDYRISPSRYPAGMSFSGAARAGRWYVLAGACAIEVGSSSWELQAGDIADIPAGGYRFRALGSDGVELVRVWELPPGSRGGGGA
jgi:mannose-6-phosphate isomerase-like protein (cupin superfamily)